MTLQEAIVICKEMQKWRRGEGKYSTEEPHPLPYSPKTYGEALDKLIKFTESSFQCNDLFKIMSNIKKANK